MPCFDGELSEILVHPLGTPFNVSDNHANHLCPGLYARARVMGSYPEIVAKPNICVTEMPSNAVAVLLRDQPSF